jgi:hypothetical protein
MHSSLDASLIHGSQWQIVIGSEIRPSDWSNDISCWSLPACTSLDRNGNMTSAKVVVDIRLRNEVDLEGVCVPGNEFVVAGDRKNAVSGAQEIEFLVEILVGNRTEGIVTDVPRKKDHVGVLRIYEANPLSQLGFSDQITEMEIRGEQDAELAVLRRDAAGFEVDIDDPGGLKVDVADDLFGNNENDGQDEPPFPDAIDVTGKKIEVRVGQADQVESDERKQEIAQIEEIRGGECAEKPGNGKRKYAWEHLGREKDDKEGDRKIAVEMLQSRGALERGAAMRNREIDEASFNTSSQ